MAHSNQDTLIAATLNNLADITAAQTFTGIQTFTGAGNPRVNSSADLSEQSSTPATPSSGVARLYATNDNPPRLVMIQDDGDARIVGGYVWNETRRSWVLINPDTPALTDDFPGQIVIRDDFFKVYVDATNNFILTAQGGWGIIATGTDAYPTVLKSGGVIRVQTGAIANNRVALVAGISTTDAGYFVRADQLDFEVVLDPVETTTKVIQCGVALTPGNSLSPGADGIYWEYYSVDSANWIGVVRTGSANTDSDSTVPAQAGTIHLRFVVDGGVNVRFYTRTASTEPWTLRATNTGAQPAAATALIPFFFVETTAAVARNLDLYRTQIIGQLED